MRPKGILGSCLVLSEPKMRLLWLKTYKRPFLHWQSLRQLPHMWATGSEGETKKLSLFVVPEPRAVLARGAAAPPSPLGHVEPDTSSLWMDLFSLDSVILIMVTCNCLPIHTRGRFFGDISHDISQITFRSLPIWKFSRGGYPHTPLQGSCIRHSR